MQKLKKVVGRSPPTKWADCRWPQSGMLSRCWVVCPAGVVGIYVTFFV